MKTFTNEDVAKILRNVAAAYTIQNEAKYRFQILAYQKAADSIEATTTEIKDLIKDNALDKLDGVGTSIKGHISELFEKGHLQYFDSILEKVSPAVFPLLDIPSFGPKKAFKIVNAFNLSEPKSVIDDVYKLGKEGKIAPLEDRKSVV